MADNDKEVKEFESELSTCSYNVEMLSKGVCPFTRFYSHKVVFIGKTGSRTEFLYNNPRAGVYSAEFFKDFGGNEEYALYFNKILLYNRYWAKGQPVSVVVNLIEMKLPLSEYVDSLQQGDTFDGMPVYRDIITNYYMNTWRD